MAQFSGHNRKTREAMRNAPTKVSLAADQAKFDRDVLRPGSDAARLQGYQNYRQKKLADEAHKRAMDLEGKKQAGDTTRTGMRQKGQLAVADRQQIGGTRRQKMITGLNRDKFKFDITDKNRRFGLEQKKFKFNSDQKTQEFDFKRNKEAFNRFKDMNSMGAPQKDAMGGILPGTGRKFSEIKDDWNAFRKGVFVDDDEYNAIKNKKKSGKIHGNSMAYDRVPNTRGQRSAPGMNNNMIRPPQSTTNGNVNPQGWGSVWDSIRGATAQGVEKNLNDYKKKSGRRF